jgi:hypothetical protein
MAKKTSKKATKTEQTADAKDSSNVSKQAGAEVSATPTTQPAGKSSNKPAASTKAKPASAPTPPQHTGIDPHQHAHSAVASLLARRQQGGSTGTGSGGGTSAVQKLKESMNKPQLPASSQFAQANKQTKSHTPAGFGQQRGHHQNSGPNVARTGVPRRTSGG